VSVRRPCVKGANPGDLDIVFVDLEASATLLEAAEAEVPRLSAADIAHLDKLAVDRQTRRLWRLARIATRVVLERSVGPSHRKVDFVIAAGGRPSLREEPPYFNISHSGEAVLIAVSKSAPVGVDLEKERSLAMTEVRRRRIVAAAARLIDGPPLLPASDADVVKAWVRLEATAKALGTGIGRLLTAEGVIGGDCDTGGAATASLLDVRNLRVAGGYAAAVAAETLAQDVRAHAFPTDAGELSKFLLQLRSSAAF
jgi:4'-phosphopantetheinyl transferase